MKFRKRNRLKGFDYSSNNGYFVTICVHNHHHLFAEIKNEESVLSASGTMISKWWGELDDKFPEIVLDQFIIMPNHIHGIIFLFNEHLVGDDLRVVPENKPVPDDLRVVPDRIVPGNSEKQTRISLSRVIQWFKTMTTNEYIRGVKENIYPPFDKHLWQRSFYDRIIRNEKELENIRNYILYNPLKWE
ncbi:MAG: transposase [Ignavibacteria bacterium]|nr:transposase [Ignavibacteria bacterium]